MATVERWSITTIVFLQIQLPSRSNFYGARSVEGWTSQLPLVCMNWTISTGSFFGYVYLYSLNMKHSLSFSQTPCNVHLENAPLERVELTSSFPFLIEAWGTRVALHRNLKVKCFVGVPQIQVLSPQGTSIICALPNRSDMARHQKGKPRPTTFIDP